MYQSQPSNSSSGGKRLRRPSIVSKLERNPDLNTATESEQSTDEQRRVLLELLREHASAPSQAKNPHYLNKLKEVSHAPEGHLWEILLSGGAEVFKVSLVDGELAVERRIHSDEPKHAIRGEHFLPLADGRIFLSGDSAANEGFVLNYLNEHSPIEEMMHWIRIVQPDQAIAPFRTHLLADDLGGFVTVKAFSQPD